MRRRPSTSARALPSRSSVIRRPASTAPRASAALRNPGVWLDRSGDASIATRRFVSRLLARKFVADSVPAHMRPERSFQGLILTLQRYWADQGCVIVQPYDLEMGAGTFHPATTLRALGPKRWNAAYVQPSRRPKDGRYGENPNRMQYYYQFQVILKPSPPNLQQ